LLPSPSQRPLVGAGAHVLVARARAKAQHPVRIVNVGDTAMGNRDRQKKEPKKPKQPKKP